MEDSERNALLTLACVRGIGPIAIRDALTRADGLSTALEELSASARRDAEQRCQRVQRDAARAGATVLAQGDAGYPPAMMDLEDPPAYLVALGDVAWLSTPMVAIVGTREATPYGERIATRLAGELAGIGVTVVSGLARGIDTAAHRGALARTGATIAVVAGGVDLATPPRQRAVHAAIAERGLVISEQPCGATPRPGSFPRRNRLIAALGAATIVIEAGFRSGARLTANLAGEIGRPIGAVPGGIESPSSAGTNGLIRDGATPITCVADILLLGGLTAFADVRATDATSSKHAAMRDDPLGEQLWNRLRRNGATLDVLVVETERSAREVLQALTALEVAGLVRADASEYAAI